MTIGNYEFENNNSFEKQHFHEYPCISEIDKRV